MRTGTSFVERSAAAIWVGMTKTAASTRLRRMRRSGDRALSSFPRDRRDATKRKRLACCAANLRVFVVDPFEFRELEADHVARRGAQHGPLQAREIRRDLQRIRVGSPHNTPSAFALLRLAGRGGKKTGRDRRIAAFSSTWCLLQFSSFQPKSPPPSAPRNLCPFASLTFRAVFSTCPISSRAIAAFSGKRDSNPN